MLPADDFVSTHHYPTDSCQKGVDWDPECFSNGVLTSRRAVAPTTPFYLTEYNVGCCLGYEGHDVSTAAAFAFRSVGDLNEELDLYSYWTFTDVFEEGGLPRTEYKNVYGAMSISGVPKPVWRAFELLHTHAGDLRLDVKLSNQTHPDSDTPQMRVTTRKPHALWAVAVPCNASDPTQLGWAFSGGALQWSSGSGVSGGNEGDASAGERGEVTPQCLDSLSSRSALQLSACSYLQPSQTFQRVGDAYRQQGRCLDVFAPDTPKYRRVDLYQCNGGANQRFTLTAHGALAAQSKACVAARLTPAGPPPPPPPPPAQPKAYISAFATLNSTLPGGGVLGGVRAFLSFWADPSATTGALPANRTVRLFVRHADGPRAGEGTSSGAPSVSLADATSSAASPAASPLASPPTAVIYSIDDTNVHPAASWVAMGRPATPNASQLAALIAASQVHVRRGVPIQRLNGSCSYLEVLMRPNSVAVVALDGHGES